MDKDTIPVVEEQARIAKEKVRSGLVTVEKTVRTETVAVEAEAETQSVVVERVKVDRPVLGPVPDRWEGETLVVSVLEEEVVVEKRLRVVEEIRLTRRLSSHTVHEEVPVRHEDVHIKREEG